MDQKTDLQYRLSSRKFWAMNYFEALWVVLMLVGKLDMDHFIDLTYLTVGSYFLANVVGKFAPK